MGMESICALEMNWKLTVVTNLNEPLRRLWWCNSGENTNKKITFCWVQNRIDFQPNQKWWHPPHTHTLPTNHTVKVSYCHTHLPSSVQNWKTDMHSLETIPTHLPNTDEQLREQNNIPHSPWVAKQGQHGFNGHTVPVHDDAGTVSGGAPCGCREMQLIHDDAAIIRYRADPLQPRMVEDGEDHTLQQRHKITDKKHCSILEQYLLNV